MNLIKRHLELLIATILVCSVITCNIYYNIDDKVFIALLGSIISFYFGSLKMKIENDKIFKELFQEFNNKYDSSFNDLLNTLKYSKVQNKNLTEDELNCVIDYFNLCSEEYLWYSRNRIPKKVWLSWKSGILENLKIEQILKVYKTEISSENGRNSFYGLVKELNLKL